ncbi:DDE-type integrase/transposase/recombinase [Rhizobium leguminosarum]|uniref:DDE-type integrase/transposase/recombinase n=1 Tax=Rhizobium leguminosarum TaxID=384 RepID=UPI00103A2D7B|nr:DDE-type integrase/transposase/recombinase [Rhizobium leguminosarum]TBY80629.1 transposase [Rhizobium leguminosarum bv. viciae]
MTLKLDRGDRYRIPFENRTRDYTFVKQVAGGPLIFVDEITGRPTDFKPRDLAKMIADRVAIPLLSSNWIERIDVYALMDASAPHTSLETRKKILAAQEKVAEASMMHFYVVRFDAANGAYSTSRPGLAALVEHNYQAACRSGHLHRPSYSALYRALQKGVPHQRWLSDLISKRGAHSKRKWSDAWVVERLEKAVEHFYSNGNPKPPQLHEVVTTFLAEAILEDRRRSVNGEPSLKYPKKTALENFIRGEETPERLARRDPIVALRKYGGKAQGATADFPLQKVQIDQTQIDEWINIYDEDGNIEDRKRPWLVSILDVYSRMILAAILTFEEPSSYTVQLAIKQMLRPKLFLIDRYGRREGATDGSGQPMAMTLDNAVENVGVSMRLLLGDAGIDMEVAPIGTPQAKAIVERCFHSYNQGLWHNAPGGIPYKPHAISARRLKPQEKAQWALDFATGVMWDWIVNVHHLRRNRSLEGIPARLWTEKVNDPMVGRSVSKRLDLFDVFCGHRKWLRIDGAGVIYDGHVFHHPKVTADFLKATLPLAKRSKGKLEVQAIVYPHDCSFITIIDPVLNRFVRLPNAKARFADGLTYPEAKSIRATDLKLDRDFVSEEELILAKYEYFKKLDMARAQERAERALRQAKKERRKAAEEELVVWELIDGDHIELGTIEPTIRGDAPYDVPQEMPAMARRTTHKPHKDLPRGGAKAKQTREINKRVKELREETATQTDTKISVPTPPPQATGPLASIPVVENVASLLARLAADLD